MKKLIKRLISGALCLSVLVPVLPQTLAYQQDVYAEQTFTQASTQASVNVGVSTGHDFEALAGGTMGSPTDGLGSRKGSYELSQKYNNTIGGDTCLEIKRASGQFEITTNFQSTESPKIGKTVSFDVYYENVENQGANMIYLRGYAPDDDKSKEIYFGSNYNGSLGQQTIFYRYKGTTTANTQVHTTIPVKEGWNNFVVDYSKKGEVSLIWNGDVANKIVIPTKDGEFSGFIDASFVDFWSNSSSTASMYVDNVTLTTPPQIPTDIIVDDVNNTLDWTNYYGFNDVSQYEYTVDGGLSYNICDSKPEIIGNIDADKVGVRVKTPTDDVVNETIWAEDEFTYSPMQTVMFEDESDLAAFSVRSDGVFELSTDYSRSGLYSAKIGSESVAQGYNQWQFEITQNLGETLEGKVVNMWMYDEQIQNNLLMTTYNTATGNTDKVGLGIGNGINSGKGEDYYYYRLFNDGIQTTSNVERTDDWHQFTWDYTTAGKCMIYVDGIKVAETAVDGFNAFQMMDYWSNQSHNVYIDDFSITDGNTTVEVPLAPTNPVVTDTEESDSFGFTVVEGSEDLSLYEYSVDAGKTFSTVTSNPIILSGNGYDVGEVMVRLKAEDGKLPGAVLRNDKIFTDPDYAYSTQLQAMYDRVASFYEKDYTAETWVAVETALAKADEAFANKAGYLDAVNALKTAEDNLVQQIPDLLEYGFDSEEEENPFRLIYGTPDWDEITNLSVHGTQAFRVYPEYINGQYIIKYSYSFADVLTDKVLDMFMVETDGSYELTLKDSTTNNGIILYVGTTNYMAKTIVDGVESAPIDTGIRRSGWNRPEFNFTLNEGVKCYFEERNFLNTDVINGFDTIEVEYTHSSDAGFFTMDELRIREENPITEIILDDTSAVIPYYDSYEMNINNWETKTEKDYPTTDKITWVSTNPEVAFVTLGGSIENHGVGTAQVTATATSGTSATMNVECVDLGVEQVQISVSDYNDTPNFSETVTIEPGSKKVINAILTPAGVTNRSTSWQSDNTSVVTVNAGELTAVGVGEAVVTVTTEDGNKTDTINVIVKEDDFNYGTELYVATNGNDFTGDGSIENPYATIERARDEIRTNSDLPENGAVVYIRGGKYTILNGIEFEEQDQGSDSTPIKYEAYNDEEVSFVGTIDLTASDMSKVTDQSIIEKLPEASKDKVYTVDLSSYINTHKDLQYVGHSAGVISWLLEEQEKNYLYPYYSLSFGGEIQTLSRWPNEGETPSGSSYAGYTRINTVINPGANVRYWQDDVYGRDEWVHPDDRDPYDTFEIASTELSKRMQNWVGIPTDGSDILDMDIYMSGYWWTDFSDQSAQVRYIDGVNLKSDVPSAYSARNSQSYNRFYVYNLIQELDIPGEWYFDQTDYQLYFYPPEDADMTSDTALQISALEEVMFTFTDTKNLTVSGIDITGVLNYGIIIEGCDDVAFKNSTVKATELRAGTIRDTAENEVFNCGFENVEFFDVNGGVNISGGDEFTLESRNNYVINCHFKNFATVNKSYNPAVNLGGIGNIISSCIMEEGPHNAIMYYGQDHVIEFTEIFDVVTEAKDQAAIYTGRNALQRGTVIRNNYIHDIPKGTGNPNSAIYLDDVTAGVDIIDNVFENVGWGVFVNGGRDTHIQDNTFINCGNGAVINDWGYIGCNGWYETAVGLLKDPNSLEPTTVPWRDETSVYGKYEHLATLLDDSPYHSKYNTIINNTYITGNDSISLVNYMSRGVQKDATSALQDWYFEKDNIIE